MEEDDVFDPSRVDGSHFVFAKEEYHTENEWTGTGVVPTECVECGHVNSLASEGCDCHGNAGNWHACPCAVNNKANYARNHCPWCGTEYEWEDDGDAENGPHLICWCPNSDCPGDPNEPPGPPDSYFRELDATSEGR